MSRAGRPLHFLGWVLGSWVAARAGMAVLPVLWPEAPRPDTPDRAPAKTGEISEGGRLRDTALPIAAPPTIGRARLSVGAISDGPPPMILHPIEEAGLPDAFDATPPPPNDASPAMAPVAAPSASAARSPSRWSGTAWLLWRPEGVGGLAQGPLLGGSQMGVRIDYRLLGTAAQDLALYGRASRAMARPFAEEAALGLAVRPVRGLPVSLLAERRIALGRGGRDGFALLAAGGIGPRPVAPRIELEGYAQAGIVGLPGAEGFVDGKVSLDYRLGRPSAGPDLALGIGLSGGAQPGASRLDIGPQLRLRVPAGGGHLRLSAEWRGRIAGDARPARGPAITLVADF